MRLKRAKKYRKLMQQYSLTFGFREPYQILVTPSIVLDAARLKIDLDAALNRTVQGTIKPMITQCCMRHLYATNDQTVIEGAKRFERKRCGHHELEVPLSALECLTSCVDPKGSGANAHRYVVAAQEDEIRDKMRSIPGVPLIYIMRSVVLLEPMSGMSTGTRETAEKQKFRDGIRGSGSQKRKRDDDQEDTAAGEGGNGPAEQNQEGSQPKKKKKWAKGPKGPNPLSVKKPKKRANQ